MYRDLMHDGEVEAVVAPADAGDGVGRGWESNEQASLLTVEVLQGILEVVAEGMPRRKPVRVSFSKAELAGWMK